MTATRALAISTDETRVRASGDGCRSARVRRAAVPVPSPAIALQRRLEQAALRGFFDKPAAPAVRRHHAGVVAGVALLAWAILFGVLLLAGA